MQTYPGDPEVTISQAATVSDDGAAVLDVHCGSHTGTHVDAPSHTEPDGDDLEDRDVGEFVLEARFVDVAPCSPANGSDRTHSPTTSERAPTRPTSS